MKQKFIDLYMDWAKRLSELSHAQRLKVGAVIVKDDCVISYGYNGMPAGWDNDCEDRVYANEWTIDAAEWQYKDNTGHPYNLKTKPEVLHAESNAIAKLARSSNSGSGADIFITHSPCIDCAKLIYQSGISRVYYDQYYRDSSGIDFLLRSGIPVKKIGE
jgi:dCMP deaminase